MASLQDSVDRLANAFERLADRLDGIDGNGGPPTSDADRVTRHIRRFMPFYALASVWLLMLILLPTRPGTEGASQTADQFTSGGSGAVAQGSLGGSLGGDGNGSTTGTTAGGGGGGTSVQGSSQAGAADVQGLDPVAWTARGITRGGFECGPNIRQIPWSRYAAPCFPKWSGNNGGATHRGVTDKQITIVSRIFPDSANSQAVDAVVQQAGFASQDELRATYEVFVNYFNKVFELWGRQVKFIRYESEFGNSTDEAQAKGKEGACADADSIIDKLKPFLVLSASSPFGECAAERKLTVIGAGAYYPETWYKKHHPYIWAGAMECERISLQLAEYMGKRVANRPAKWAKGLLQNKPRKFGTYIPNNDEYQHCAKLYEATVKRNYNFDPGSRYNYILDISRFPDEAAKAIVQFNADGVTSILLECDPISPIFLTQSAKGQNYFPEWITNGAGLTDVDQFARLWDQEEIQWSLFGMSQLGENSRILGPKGEGTFTYKKATGTEIPPGAQTQYYSAVGLFSILQATGPILTPQTLAATYWRLPPGGAPEFEVGYTSYLDGSDGTKGAKDHTAVDDNKEIYWLCTRIGSGDAEGSSLCSEPKGPDGKGGVYVSTYGGKRFRNGEWPKGDPPVFKEKPK